MKKNRRWLCNNKIIILIILASVSPLISYLINFRNLEISDKPSDWGIFGDYIGGIYSIITVFWVIYLTRYLTKKDTMDSSRKKAAESLYFQIKKICTNNYNRNCITKLQKETDLNSLYISSDLQSKIMRLADSYLTKDEKPIDEDLEDDVLFELKEIYDNI